MHCPSRSNGPYNKCISVLINDKTVVEIKTEIAKIIKF